MACFIVPAAEAIVTTIITKVVAKKEKAEGEVVVTEGTAKISEKNHTPFSKKLKWLNNLLWGGSFLLAFEHIWSGEVVPWAPFLTATENAERTSVMLHEMATSGVAMAVLVTAFWGAMVAVSSVLEKKQAKEDKAV